MPSSAAELDHVFQALGDSTRRAVLQALGRGPLSVTELAKPFAMALPSFVQHLKVLENGGLIRTKKKGRVRTCEIEPKALAMGTQWLEQQRNLWERRLDQLDRYLAQIKQEEGKK